MNAHQLEYFIAAAEYQNFTKAAEKFYISQTAITMQIRSLENHLGVTLFERSGRHVRLTPAGHVYLEEAKSILRRIHEAERRVQLASSGYTGTIKIGFLKGCEQLDFATKLSEFTSIYTGISVLFQRSDYAELFDSLDNCENDFIINLSPSKSSGESFRCVEYETIPQYVILPLSHPYAARTSISRSELKDDSFVLLNTSDSVLNFIREGFLASGFLPNDPFYVRDMESILLMVSANMGIGIIPGFDLHLLSGFPTLRAIPLEGEAELLNVAIFWNPDNQNIAAGHLANFITNHPKRDKA